MEHFTLKIREAFLANLRAIKNDRGLSYKDIGDMIGASKQNVSDVFNGNRGITFATVEKFAKAFGVEETDLVDPGYKVGAKK